MIPMAMPPGAENPNSLCPSWFILTWMMLTHSTVSNTPPQPKQVHRPFQASAAKVRGRRSDDPILHTGRPCAAAEP
jgi:hypothetical protein